MKIAAVFPGQGSQAVGMLSELSRAFPVVKETFDEASEVLDFDCWSLIVKGPERELNRTHNTQPIMLAAGVAVWRVWNVGGGCQPELMAGHSFGEYTALVCSGALDYTDALPLARKRGQLMQAAVPEGQGAMAAVLGLKDQQVVEICESAAEDQVVAAVNFNSPVQVVIAGDKAAVERASQLASKAGARRVIPLAVSVPAHCRLMASAARKLADSLAKVAFKSPKIPVLHNVDVKTHADADEIRDVLARQLELPVRWTETIQTMGAQGVNAILEMGPGKVLTGLNRRIERKLRPLCVQGPAGLEKALQNCEDAQ
ncbi:MAG: ACP S-malonyltransferase [Gammaproteobacteria bacterium]|nr:ACP S-malonyltransferase [Gammaproteobacteria bacterium]